MRNSGKLFASFMVLFLSLGTIAGAASNKPKPNYPVKKVGGTPQDKVGKPVKAAEAEEIPVYAPSHVKQNLVPPGVFETEGYITFVHNPYNGQMHQRLIIVNELKTGPENTAIRIKIKDAQGLQKGGHYRFTVRAEQGKTPQQPLELIEFNEIKD